MPIEEQLLPHKDLARFYEKVSWLYVCRTFQKKPEKDRVALRAHDRFGISSWPQMLVFDPRTDAVLATPPRDLKGFVATFDRVIAKWKPPAEAERKDPDPEAFARALRLEEWARGLQHRILTEAEKEDVLRLVRDEEQDIVVRIRAIRLLRVIAPRKISGDVATFLKVANDQWRYEVLGLAKDHPVAACTGAILDLVRNVGKVDPSRNPNVVRIRAIESLGRCGDASAVDPVIEMMGGPLNNSLTRLAPRSLAEIGSRLTDERPKITAALLAALPAAVDDAASKQGVYRQRLSTAMAREIAAAIGRLSLKPAPKVPRTWSAVDRRELEESLRTLLEGR